MDFPGGEVLAVERAGVDAYTGRGTDRFGARVPGTAHPIGPCALAMESTEERHEASNTVISRISVKAPYGSDVAAADVIVRSDGTRWEVLGKPFNWLNGFTGWQAGTAFRMEEVTG